MPRRTKRDWIKDNPEKYQEWLYHHKRKPGYFEKSLLRKVRGRCSRSGMPFDLTLEDIVVPKRCPVLGMKLKIRVDHGKKYDDTPSIDRIDNRLGYVKGNVIIVSWRANRLKSDATPKELRRLAKFYGKR